jgi:hypothetical protein
MFVSDEMIFDVYIAPKDTYTFDSVYYLANKYLQQFNQCMVHTAEEVKFANNLMLRENGYVTPYYFKKNILKNRSLPNIKHFEYAYDYFNYYNIDFYNNDLDWWCGKKINKTNIKMCPKFDFLKLSNDFKPEHYKFKLYHNNKLKFEDALVEYIESGAKIEEEWIIDIFFELKQKTKMTNQQILKKILNIIQYSSYKIIKNEKSNKVISYDFILNFYNKYNDLKIREMAKFSASMYFIRKMMSEIPNLNLFLLGPANNLYKITNIVTKIGKNVLVKTKKNKKSLVNKINEIIGNNFFEQLENKKYQHIFSIDSTTNLYCFVKKYEKKMKFRNVNSHFKNIRIPNLLYGEKKLELEPILRNEKLYSFVLEGKIKQNDKIPIMDYYKNLYYFENYSENINLDIIC